MGTTHTREGGALTGGAPKTEGVRQEAEPAQRTMNIVGQRPTKNHVNVVEGARGGEP